MLRQGITTIAILNAILTEYGIQLEKVFTESEHPQEYQVLNFAKDNTNIMIPIYDVQK